MKRKRIDPPELPDSGAAPSAASLPTVLEHAIDACYSGGPGEPYYQPVLMCSCGFETGRCDNWEIAGSAMDDHLKGVKEFAA